MFRETVTLCVNGKRHVVTLDARRTLFDALRHDLSLTGTKKGCDTGDRGACTVQVDGFAMYALASALVRRALGGLVGVTVC